MNPYDEFAVEQALLVKAANSGSTVTVVRVGGVKDTEALRTALCVAAGATGQSARFCRRA